MLKKININENEYIPGYLTCQGCPHLTIGSSWYCAFEPETQNCAYPETWGVAGDWEEIEELEAGQVGAMGVKCLR